MGQSGGVFHHIHRVQTKPKSLKLGSRNLRLIEDDEARGEAASE